MSKDYDYRTPLSVDAVSPPVAPEAPFTSLVLSLMKAMTLDEKMALVAGDDAPDKNERPQTGYLPGVPRLGVPPRRDSDGDGLDMHGFTETTSFPSRVGVAATFDRTASRDQGIIQGREARANEYDLLYAPQLDICRSPNFGRNNTTFGEDPYLSGQMGIGEVTGMQSQGLMAQIKHYIMYNGQLGVPFAWRPIVPTVVDDRTLHEIYLPPFETAIKEAKPSSVMGSYQMFRVTPQQLTPNWACGNSHTLISILRGQLDFKGFVLSDYGATHATDEILNGLDQQYMNARPAVTPNFGGPYFGADLRPFVDPESSNYSLTYAQALDRAVAYVLYQYERFGLMACASPQGPVDGKLPERPTMDKKAGMAVSLRLAEEAPVLLKNDNYVLPLSDEVLREGIAVIGPTASQMMANGLDAERSGGYDDRVALSPLHSMRQQAPDDAKISYSVGVDWMGDTVPATAFNGGLARTSDKSKETVIDDNINFWNSEELKPGEAYTWSSKLHVPVTATYYLWIQQNFRIPARFYGDLWGVPQTKIFIDGGEIKMEDIPVPLSTYPENFMPENGVNIGGSRIIKEGEHDITITTTIPAEMEQLVSFRLTWSNFDETMRGAVEAAKKAKVAVVFADDNGGPPSVDTLTGLNPLADNQDTLIKAVAEVNSNTVVVVTSGNLVDMPWFSDVAAVMEVWYPGQEGGTAIANLLYGKANPSGRLPLTLPKSWDDTAFAEHPERYLGANGEVTFSDGLFVGYRWYDHMNIKPFLPFGFGLSYTTFEYSDMDTKATDDGGLTVSFAVCNTGSVEGTAIPQVYVGKPESISADIPHVEKSLAQFNRVLLQPGEKKSAELHIAPRAFEHWNVNEQTWIRDLGKRRISVGTSSGELILNKIVDIE